GRPLATTIRFPTSGDGDGSGGRRRRGRQARAEVPVPEGCVLCFRAVVAAAVVEVERVAERVVPELPRGRHTPPPPGPDPALRPLPAAAWRGRRAEAAADGGPQLVAQRRRRVGRSGGLHGVHGVCLGACVLQLE
uniref:Uncharacterized protein n=1 Tax=Triticum urartu TaxID=4572 RepID=A0A8R7VBT1_TRIUA